MNKYFYALLFLATALIVTSPAIAEVQGGAFTISPFVGGYTFDGTQHLKTNMATGLGLGYNLNKNWGVEGQFTWVPLQASHGDIPGDYSLFNFHGDVLYHFMPESRFVPFVALGAGLSRTEWQTYNNNDAVLVYGGGVKYFLNDWLALRGDVRQIFSFHTDNSGGTDCWNNFEYTVGLTFQFGRTKPVTPAVQAETPGAVTPAPPTQAQEPLTPTPEPSQGPPPTLEEQQSWHAKEGAAELQKDNIVLTGMTIHPNALELEFTKSFYYEIHVLSEPSRLAIDIPGAVNSLGVDMVAVNKIGIATVRFENQARFFRIILFPLAGTPLPSRIDLVDNFRKLLINMATPVQKSK